MEQRRSLWKDLYNLNLQGPWCLVGDLNNILKSQDRIGGNIVTEAEVGDLKDMMDRKDLSEMASSGDYYTWYSKHSVGTIYSRIEKVLGNTAWFQAHLNITLKIFPSNVSDHSLLYLVNQDALQSITKGLGQMCD